MARSEDLDDDIPQLVSDSSEDGESNSKFTASKSSNLMSNNTTIQKKFASTVVSSSSSLGGISLNSKSSKKFKSETFVKSKTTVKNDKLNEPPPLLSDSGSDSSAGLHKKTSACLPKENITKANSSSKVN